MSDIKKLRRLLGVSQGELAKILDVTQATVSRFENGKAPISPEVFKKLTSLLDNSKVKSESLPTKNALVAKYQFEEKFHDLENGWNAFYVTSLSQAENSDLVLLDASSKSNRIPFLIGDMTGHGRESAYMAFGIKFALECFLALMSTNMISAEFINSFIAQGIKRTKDQWKDNPSLITGVITTDRNEIEMINNGMPHPLHISSNGSKFFNNERLPAIDINSKSNYFNATKISLKKGDSVIFFSDGLLDILSEAQLLKYANSDLQYFKGDSKAIGKNILRATKNKLSDLRDDISFLVISAKN